MSSRRLFAVTAVVSALSFALATVLLLVPTASAGARTAPAASGATVQPQALPSSRKQALAAQRRTLRAIKLHPAAKATTSSGWTSAPETLSRTYYPGQTVTKYTENYTDEEGTPFSVHVDKTTDLQARERVEVSWKGAVPTGGIQGNPYGNSGLDQEYPVAIMECRGTGAAVNPDTCWTTTNLERSISADASTAPWRDDLYASAADKAVDSGYTGQLPSVCTLSNGFAYHFVPFITAAGKTFAACDPSQMPPEAALNSVDPPNEVFASTKTDGTGNFSFEVRTVTENESLGCSQKVACSLVVVPIVGLSCADPSSVPAGVKCNQTPRYFPGQHTDGTDPSQQSLSGYYWWSASNWRNRVVVPLSFAPPPNVCSATAVGKAVPFYGSELLSQAALQWAPAYCLNKKRFNWQANSMPDDAAVSLVDNGGAIAAQPAGKPSDVDTKGLAFAPTALTGFGIAFDVDDPTSGQPLESLKLNARLLAKLLTESYPADAIGAQHPGLQSNPLTLESDPEFLKLNPDFHPIQGASQSVGAATLLALSNGSQVMEQLTQYINADPDARAFLDGKADPWGMKVNPAYKGIKLPVTTWPLLDTWKATGNDCLNNNPMVYLQNLAYPVSSLRLIATAMLFNWPESQVCAGKDPSTGLYTIGRGGVQSYGQRFMLGIVTLGDAARYALPVAQLQAKPNHYVAPTDASMEAAVKLTKQSGRWQPFDLDQKQVRKSTKAYPGTMIVYTAAKTSGLAKPDAAKVAQFIQISSTEGQKPGRGNGQLPQGYVPITKTGATKPLYDAAVSARAAILAQKPPRTPGSGSSAAGTTSTSAPPTTPSVTPPSSGPSAPAPAAVSSAPNATSSGSSTTTEVPLATTAAVTSGLGGGLLPVLLAVGLVAGAVTVGGRIWLFFKGAR